MAEKILGVLMGLVALVPFFLCTILYLMAPPNTMWLAESGLWHWFPIVVAWAVVVEGWIISPILLYLVIQEMFRGV